MASRFLNSNISQVEFAENEDAQEFESLLPGDSFYHMGELLIKIDEHNGFSLTTFRVTSVSQRRLVHICETHVFAQREPFSEEQLGAALKAIRQHNTKGHQHGVNVGRDQNPALDGQERSQTDLPKPDGGR